MELTTPAVMLPAFMQVADTPMYTHQQGIRFNICAWLAGKFAISYRKIHTPFVDLLDTFECILRKRDF